MPGAKLQRPRAGDDAGGFGVAERRLGRRAVQHRHRPVVAQAGLVVAQMQRAGRRLLQQRQAGAHVAVQHRRVGKGVQHHAAGELLGDRAHAEQRARREGNAPLGVGPAPGVANQDLAVAQHGDRAAGSGIGAGQGVDSAVEAGGERGHHGRHSRVFARGGQLPKQLIRLYFLSLLAGAPGFEPGITGPKPVALPLGHAPIPARRGAAT